MEGPDREPGSTARSGPPANRDDRAASLGAVLAYSLGLGIATVTIPLLALDSGYDAAAVGFLVATAAACQFGTRLALPWLLGRFPDRALIGIASAGMVSAFLLLIASTALPVFIVAQLFQGASRAIFWTSSQTHAIRGPGKPVRRLVDLNVAGNAGTLSGPAIGGMLAVIGLPVALAAAAVAATIGGLTTLGMHRLPPYDRRRSAGTLQLLGRKDVGLACWSSAVSGLWWSMVGSYFPVLGVGLGIGSVGIGWLITAAEGAGMVALIALRGVRSERVRPIVVAASAGTLAALIAVAVAASSDIEAITLAFAVAMTAGGAVSGTITTLAPALASLAAGPDEQGDALALTGMFRAGALLAAPAAVGAMLGVVGVPAAIVVATATLGLPGAVLGRTPRAASREA